MNNFENIIKRLELSRNQIMEEASKIGLEMAKYIKNNINTFEFSKNLENRKFEYNQNNFLDINFIKDLKRKADIYNINKNNIYSAIHNNIGDITEIKKVDIENEEIKKRLSYKLNLKIQKGQFNK